MQLPSVPIKAATSNSSGTSSTCSKIKVEVTFKCLAAAVESSYLKKSQNFTNTECPRIYSPAEGQKIGLQGMVDDMIERCLIRGQAGKIVPVEKFQTNEERDLAQFISEIEAGSAKVKSLIKKNLRNRRNIPVLGITGTGGSGKSSLTDELMHRIQLYCDSSLRTAIVAIDPSRRKTGGALLGDRIRMSSTDSTNLYMRSLATPGKGWRHT